MIIALDRLSKLLVMRYMELHQSIVIVGPDFFRLSYVENPGIAFGITFGNGIILTIFTIAAVILLAFYLYNQRRGLFPPRLSLAIILGGAIGNLWDRLLYGRVVDFLDFDFPDFITIRFPVFNIADSSVTVGMTILIIYMIFFEPRKKLTSLEVNDDNAVGRDNPSSFPAAKEGAD